VEESGRALQEIVAAVKKVTDIVAEIAAASREQSTGIEQVNRGRGADGKLSVTHSMGTTVCPRTPPTGWTMT
jgi:hypothetical protein